MINKSISTSKQANLLSAKHAILFTWSLPHLDDYGDITNDPEVFKAIVVPMRKDITVKDCADYIKISQEIGLTKMYKDCLSYLGFDNHQNISSEKRAKSHFDKTEINALEILGDSENALKSPVQDKEDKIREFKLREDKGLAPTLPKTQAENFFFIAESGSQEFLDFSRQLSEQSGASEQVISRELKKFVNYWTELNSTGTKQRWQMEKVFEVKKRLITWLTRAGQWSSEKKKGKTISI